MLLPTEAAEPSKTVVYVINSQHTYKFKITVDGTDIARSSSKKMHLSSEGSTDFTTTETLTLTNPGNAVADFNWQMSGGPCSVIPESGSIEPGGSYEVSVTFAPTLGAKNSEKLDLVIDDGNDETLEVMGQAEDAKCRFIDKVVDFGTLAVGLEQERTVRLKSEGKDPAVFSVQQIPGSGIIVVPSKGLSVLGSVVPRVKLTPPSVHVYDSELLVVSAIAA